ncbi:MAG: 2-amino-3,7-dideoxy-D-threo-hept-6-ulosonate synthase [Candidatus Bathyarchaeota archaeon]|nr:2-amino-3,7-dideoxy-D-threo-hept-6-ulosonate synthase [Candidatus Bathyarchaeota archaeon]
MSQIGKAIRLERIMNRDTGRTIIVPMDHGVSLGPVPGLIDMADMVNKVAEGGADAVLGHIGLPLYGHRRYGRDIGLILHLMGSSVLSPDPNNKVMVMTVEEALVIGADAVSVHINVGAETDPEMFRILGQVSRQCMRWGMPLVAMMYPRGKKVKSEHDVEAVKLAARIGAELGADIVKTNYTGDIDSFKQVVAGCQAPVVIAGGPKMDTQEDVLQMAWEAMQAGSAGASIGRNVFQAPDPAKMVRALHRVVHEGWNAQEAKRELQ